MKRSIPRVVPACSPAGELAYTPAAIIRSTAANQTPDSAWLAELWLRISTGFLWKATGTTLVISLFFVAYFHLQEHPAFPVTIMPLTGLDLAITPEPAALIAYLSLWVYVGVGPGLQRNLREAMIYGVWMIALCLAGLTIFYFWPTRVPIPDLDTPVAGMLAMLKHVDAAGNAFPSMHVAGATFTMIRVGELLNRLRAPAWLRMTNLAWFAVIAWSTLATKQHVALDVAGGAALGLAFALASLRFRRKRRATVMA